MTRTPAIRITTALRRMALLAAIAITVALAPGGHADADTGFVPLSDLGTGTYLGFEGGLYENGYNTVPGDHHAAGLAKAGQVQPLDVTGAPSLSGKVVLLSVGMSNTTQEFCSGSSALPCDAFTFMGRAAVDATVNHTTLAIVNGAAGGQTAATWDNAADANYDRVRDTRLTPAGLSEQQVQAVWLKVANAGPTTSLPAANADAYVLETHMGNIVRALRTRYPNIKLVFVSTRIYAGYASTTLNPEPYAYEYGFSAKWLIQAQVDQMRNAGVVVDPRAGDLNYNTGAPWIGWSAYLWADGLTPRTDGLTWLASDFAADGTHPATGGRSKVGAMLLDAFKASPYAACWFLAGGCGPDDDSDGCSNAEETGGDHLFGGERNPLDPWDFFDVTGDRVIDLNDAIDVLGFFGDAGTSPATNLRDRAVPNGLYPWLSTEANDGIDLNDAINALLSFGDDCSAAL